MAKMMDRPILVSIGYSSCHWCHVMERETFENEAIAEYMNRHFVNIKVDREERADLDNLYMDAVHAMGQRGGWPLNVFLTPDQKPFYGGTYFPPKNWKNLLESIERSFSGQRSEIESAAKKLTDHLQGGTLEKVGITMGGEVEEVDRQVLDEGHRHLLRQTDPVWGGMKPAPKFPMPSNWRSVLKYLYAEKDGELEDVLLITLGQMAKGGIYDQVGGGFARYSTDDKWFAPHFEKMLYDNGQLMSLYAEAWQVFGKDEYRRVVYQTRDWLEREMKSPEGGYYSALDADTEGVEGYYYTWAEGELRHVLGSDYELVKKLYNFSESGNWENGRSILFRRFDAEEFMDMHDLQVVEFYELKERIDGKLLQARKERSFPGIDDKIIAGWNALVISGFVSAYKAFGDESFLDLALSAADFLSRNLMEEGVLYRSFKETRSKTEGFLDDYAFVIQAYIDIYEATFDENWLGRAEYLSLRVLDLFFDPDEKLFFYTSEEAEALITRQKEVFDNVIPSSNSQMAMNLIRLGVMLDKDEYYATGKAMVETLSPLISQQPSHMSNWLQAAFLINRKLREVVIVGEEVATLRKEFSRNFLPDCVFLGTENFSELSLLKGRTGNSRGTTIYVCLDHTCQLPVKTVEEAMAQIK